VSALSRLVYNVFQPSLLFTNVMQTLAAPSPGDQSKATLLLLPLAAILQILLASVVSAAVVRLANIPPNSEEGRETRICSTFANAGRSVEHCVCDGWPRCEVGWMGSVVQAESPHLSLSPTPCRC
jgi:hypothetical protein